MKKIIFIILFLSITSFAFAKVVNDISIGNINDFPTLSLKTISGVTFYLTKNMSASDNSIIKVCIDGQTFIIYNNKSITQVMGNDGRPSKCD